MPILLRDEIEVRFMARVLGYTVEIDVDGQLVLYTGVFNGELAKCIDRPEDCGGGLEKCPDDQIRCDVHADAFESTFCVVCEGKPGFTVCKKCGKELVSG